VLYSCVRGDKYVGEGDDGDLGDDLGESISSFLFIYHL
tara:strand:- start:141 stop:254 length:114 start_codon:yes stop_codon:yes gene_type:complete